MRTKALFIIVALASACSVSVDDTGTTRQAGTISSDLVIAEIYGGGGNAGAAFTNDFVVLFNRGTAAASLSGLRLTYGSTTGNFGTGGSTVVDLPADSIPPGGSYFVRLASGGANGAALPTADATGSINMSASGGKIALTPITGGLGACGSTTTACDPTKWIDLLGWGSGTTAYEGTRGGNTATSTGLTRKASGCIDTGDNGADFTVGAPPTPRTSATTATPCAAVDMAGVDLATGADAATSPDLAGADLSAVPINALLNEVKWNPAGSDSGQEFIELIGTGTLPANVWVLSVEGDAASTPGRINYARDLGGQAFGANGLILIKGATSMIAGVAAETAVVDDAILNGTPLQNGTESILLVQSASALTIVPGTTNFSTLTVTIVDSIAARASTSDTIYGGAGFAPCPTVDPSAIDGAYRLVGDTRAQTLAAWVGGQGVGAATDQFLNAVSDCTAGAPATGVLSPGRANDDPFMSPPDLAGGIDLAMAPEDLAEPPFDLASARDLAASSGDLAGTAPRDMAQARLVRDDGCAMAPGGAASPLALLLVAALLVLSRRRAVTR